MWKGENVLGEKEEKRRREARSNMGMSEGAYEEENKRRMKREDEVGRGDSRRGEGRWC